MSRLSAWRESLKAAFRAEAESAALFRAFAEKARKEGKENLARALEDIASSKDALAASLLDKSGRINDSYSNLKELIAMEQYEIDLLYPRLADFCVEDGREDLVDYLSGIREKHKKVVDQLDNLIEKLEESPKDIKV